MAKRDIVTLTEDARAYLLALTKKGKIAACKLTHAHILLQADAGDMDAVIAATLMWALRRWSGSASALSKRASKRL
jgi:Trk K+ transport system NAD-binding subunit